MTPAQQQAKRTSINFGKVDKFFFLGGGQCLFDAVCHLKSRGFATIVITSDRHYHADVNMDRQRKPLFDALASVGIECLLVKQLDVDLKIFDGFDSTSLAVTPSAEWIFKESLIEKLSGRIVNIHGSHLPEMKGGGGLSWNLMMGVKECGATIHMIDSGIDTGDILLQQKYQLPESVSVLSEAMAIAQLRNSQLMISFLDKVVAGETFLRQSQETQNGSYWPRLRTDTHGFIDWTWSANEISLFCSAFSAPYKGASTFLDDKRVRIFKCREDTERRVFHPFQYGLVFRVGNGVAYIAAKGSALIVDEIKYETGVAVDVQRLLGRRLHSTPGFLEAAIRQRVVFGKVSDLDEYRVNL